MKYLLFFLPLSLPLLSMNNTGLSEELKLVRVSAKEFADRNIERDQAEASRRKKLIRDITTLLIERDRATRKHEYHALALSNSFLPVLIARYHHFSEPSSPISHDLLTEQAFNIIEKHISNLKNYAYKLVDEKIDQLFSNRLSMPLDLCEISLLTQDTLNDFYLLFFKYILEKTPFCKEMGESILNRAMDESQKFITLRLDDQNECLNEGLIDANTVKSISLEMLKELTRRFFELQSDLLSSLMQCRTRLTFY